MTGSGGVRHARRVLAAQTALAVAAVLLLACGAVVWGVAREQGRAADDALRRAVDRADADDLAEPPPGLHVFVLGPAGAVLRASPRSPAGLPDPRGLAATASGPAWTVLATRTGRFRTLTVVSGGDRIQAALDLAPADTERERLVTAAAVAMAVGIAGAVGIGWFVARRVMAPLGEALERQSRFVADASHELRAPLTLLSTRAQLLARDAATASPAWVEAEAGGLASDAGRLDEVIEDLLLSARLRGGIDRRDPVALDQVAAAALEAAGPHAGQLGVGLAGELAPATVLGAGTALRRVIDALLDNAVSLSPAGTEVRLTVAQRDGQAVLEVADQGPGLGQGGAGRLFERFAHGPQQAGRRVRFGLGLALVREVVNAHGGQVEAAPGAAGGAVFTVRLPSAGRPGRLPRSV
jgi:signal transduction histidine kinase